MKYIKRTLPAWLICIGTIAAVWLLIHWIPFTLLPKGDIGVTGIRLSNLGFIGTTTITDPEAVAHIVETFQTERVCFDEISYGFDSAWQLEFITDIGEVVSTFRLNSAGTARRGVAIYRLRTPSARFDELWDYMYALLKTYLITPSDWPTGGELEELYPLASGEATVYVRREDRTYMKSLADGGEIGENINYSSLTATAPADRVNCHPDILFHFQNGTVAAFCTEHMYVWFGKGIAEFTAEGKLTSALVEESELGPYFGDEELMEYLLALIPEN